MTFYEKFLEELLTDFLEELVKDFIFCNCLGPEEFKQILRKIPKRISLNTLEYTSFPGKTPVGRSAIVTTGAMTGKSFEEIPEFTDTVNILE